jgi:hypothetical protein
MAAVATEPPKLTEGLRADIKLMRERVSNPSGSDASHSSGRAIEAAQRVFAALPLTGMTRQEVVDLLGEPSESIAPAGSPPRGQLSYRFDNGFGGYVYILALDGNSRVTKVTREGID